MAMARRHRFIPRRLCHCNLVIRPLIEMKFWERFAIMVMIVLTVLLVLAIGSALMVEGEIILELPFSKWDQKMLDLDREAIDRAYVNKIGQLYDVWVREGREHPERPVKGAAEAKRAYTAIQDTIEQRQKIINERKP